MGGGAGRGDPFSRMAERPVGKALLPDDKAQEGLASRAGVVTGTSGFSTVALGIVKRERFLVVPARRGELAQIEIKLAHEAMGEAEKMRISEAFREAQGLFGERQQGQQFSLVHTDACQPPTRNQRLKLRRRIWLNPLSERDRSARGPLEGR